MNSGSLLSVISSGQAGRSARNLGEITSMRLHRVVLPSRYLILTKVEAVMGTSSVCSSHSSLRSFLTFLRVLDVGISRVNDTQMGSERQCKAVESKIAPKMR